MTRCVRRHLLALASLLALAAHAGVAPPGGVEVGRDIYNARCYFCHGYSGNAKTVASGVLDPKPTDFTRRTSADLPREAILTALRQGRPGTAMKSFAGILSESEMAAVADFVTQEFMRDKAPNTRYHTVANGWREHLRHKDAFPFATGALPIDGPWEQLDPAQRRGKRLFLSACVTCHDGRRSGRLEPVWEGRALSYPRNAYQPGDAGPVVPLDALTSATPYARHDIPPRLAEMSEVEKRGEALFQGNCAFCHGADGSGKNWIGSFLQPHPRNLTDAGFMGSMTRQALVRRIAEGVPESSMPSWKSVLSEAEIHAVVAYIAKAFHPVAE